MRKRRIALIVLLAGAAVSLSGCVVAAVGAGVVGTVAYVTGDLEAVEARKLDEVHDATLEAMKALDLHVTKQTKDALSAVIVARDAQDKKITVKLNATGSEVTELSIRVGAFGNEEKSRLIYKEIRRNLRR